MKGVYSDMQVVSGTLVQTLFLEEPSGVSPRKQFQICQPHTAIHRAVLGERKRGGEHRSHGLHGQCRRRKARLHPMRTEFVDTIGRRPTTMLVHDVQTLARVLYSVLSGDSL